MQLRIRDYDTVKRDFVNESIMPDMNVWFRGNLVIEEIRTIDVRTSSGVRTKTTPLAYYLFIDRASKSFYNYTSFNDTARIIDKYQQADTAEIKGMGGWNFYKNHPLDTIGVPRLLSDTVIQGIAYKRAALVMNGEPTPSTVIAYLRCDKKGTMFQLNREFSEKMGCPLVRVDHLPFMDSYAGSSDEIVFIRDSLTKEERKVFNAWEKNLKRHPIDQK